MTSFIDEHRGENGVEPICRVLPIPPSCLMTVWHSAVIRRVRRPVQNAIKPEVQRVFYANFEVYGVREVWRQIQRESFDVARCTVERLMRDVALQGVIRGKPVKTTMSDKAAPFPLDHVNRQFQAPAPNMLRVSELASPHFGSPTSRNGPGSSL
jgi:transposase InsO family protein